MDAYVYCFCAVPLSEIQRAGVENSQVLGVEHNGITAVISDCSGGAAPSLEGVISHHRVVDSLLEVTTPIPCRFGTVLSRPGLEAYIEANRTALKHLLERVRGCIEMALRITWSSAAVTGDAENEINARSTRVLPQSGGPGARFLAEKFREAAHREIAARQAQTILDWADSRFTAVVKDRTVRLRPEAALVADIAHLIDRTRLGQYRELFCSAAAERSDLRLSISGPWAPYSFAIIDKEVHIRDEGAHIQPL
jgi:hypothetical protein